MGFVKCPRCDLNYILDGGSLCTVCRKEVRGEEEIEEIAEICSECGERPVVPGNEICAICMKDIARHIPDSTDDDDEQAEDPTLEIDSVSSMDEIAIDLEEPLDEAFDDDEVFDDDEAFDDEEEMETDIEDDDFLDR